MEKNIGICLEGGGAAGCVQAGMLYGLSPLLRSGRIKAVSGSSVGGLNAALLAQKRIDLIPKLWLNLERKDVYSYWGLLNLFSGGWFSSSPLKKLIKNHIDLNEIKKSDIRLFAQACDRDLGVPIVGTNKSDDLVDILYAGASIPVVFPQVYLEKRKAWAVDGGVVDNSPLEWITAQRDSDTHVFCEKVLILRCNSKRMPYIANKQRTRISMLGHTVKLLYRANQNYDKRRVQVENILKKTGLIPGKPIEIFELYATDSNVGTLDFDSDTILKGFRAGQRAAMRFLQKPKI